MSPSLDFLSLSAHVNGLGKRQEEISMADRRMADSKKALVFGLVAASTLVLLILIGVASTNVAAPNYLAQLNTELSAAKGSQNP